MQVLLLSCNTGEGHNACARAIQEVFKANGDTCDIRDALQFISDRASRLVSRGHVFIYRRTPLLFRLGYGYTERHSLFHETSLCRRYFSRGLNALHLQITQGAYDAVICTHPFAALMLHDVLLHYHLSIPTAFVATDYTCCPGVKDSALDYYFIPNIALTGDFLSENITKDKIIPSGIPIRQMFYKSIPSSTAKQALGLSPGRRHLVMMCGSMGCGPIKELTNLLTQEPNEEFDLTVICGTNEKRKQQLLELLGQRDNLHILGYVKDMSAILDSADLYITKPGGISVTEAAAKNVPMVFINAVDGCEEYNRRFFVELGGAKVKNNPQETAALCQSLLQNPSCRRDMAESLSREEKQNAAEVIFKTMHHVHERAIAEAGQP